MQEYLMPAKYYDIVLPSESQGKMILVIEN